MIKFEGFKKVGDLDYLLLDVSGKSVSIPLEAPIVARIQGYLGKLGASLPQIEEMSIYYQPQLDEPFSDDNS